MNVFIAVDMEGATGVVHPDQLTPDGRNYSQAQHFLTGDVNAVIRGILQVYPDASIIVGDGHATMRNVLLDELHSSARLVMGPATVANKPLCQLEGVQYGADVAMCIGYHSKAGTPGGLLAHTYIGSLISELRMNGQPAGEVEVNAAVLASRGIPLVMISGNSDLEAEIRQWNTASVFCSTKTVLGPTAALCSTPESTARELTLSAAAAMRTSDHWHCKDIGPVTFEVATKTIEQTIRACELSHVERLADMTFSVHGSSAEVAFIALWHTCLHALGDLPGWLR